MYMPPPDAYACGLGCTPLHLVLEEDDVPLGEVLRVSKILVAADPSIVLVRHVCGHAS